MSYCWRVPSGYFLARLNGRYFIIGNSGKTKVMLDNVGMLYEHKRITGALVLAPKGVYRNWSDKEIPTHLGMRPDSNNLIVWDAVNGYTNPDDQDYASLDNYNGSLLRTKDENKERI